MKKRLYQDTNSEVVIADYFHLTKMFILLLQNKTQIVS